MSEPDVCANCGEVYAEHTPKTYCAKKGVPREAKWFPKQLADALERSKMRERKTVIPGGMLKAAHDAWCDGPSSALIPVGAINGSLEAALRWMDGELAKMVKDNPYTSESYEGCRRYGYNAAITDVRRMFLALETEVPYQIKDLLTPRCNPNEQWLPCNHDWAVIEAYRRGQQSSRQTS